MQFSDMAETVISFISVLLKLKPMSNVNTYKANKEMAERIKDAITCTIVVC